MGKPPAPPSPVPLLGTLSAAMLTGYDDHQACLMHPVVAAAIRRETPAGVRDAADSQLGAYWRETADQAGNRAGAALAALPYLTRRRDWDSAAALLDDAIRHGALPTGSEDSHLPELRQVARLTAAPAACAALALVTQPVDQAEARRLLEDSLGSADSAGDYSLAWLVAGHLADALRDAGHLDQALDVVAQQSSTRRLPAGGRGRSSPGRAIAWPSWPGWTKQQFLPRDSVETAPATKENRARNSRASSPGRSAAILDQGARDAGVQPLKKSLNIGAEIQDSQRRRSASRHELAITRFFDAYPLIRLRRLTEACLLLVECQQVFEDEGDTGNLSHVFTERADLDGALGHADDAVRFARSALRMTYTKTVPDPIAAAHQRLARYLGDLGGPPEEQQAHWLAAALVYRLGGMDHALDDLMLSAPPGLSAGQGLCASPVSLTRIPGPSPR